MSVRRPRRLRLDTFEDRVVPALAIGTNVDSLGSASVPALGNSGAVGPDHVVQFQTGNFLVFDKAGNFLVNESDFQFWQDAGIDFTQMVSGVSQPRVTYDVLTDRWFAMEINLNSTANEVFVARSDTNDPTGTWTALSYIGSATQFANFPTLGVDANGVYVGTANFLNRDSPSPTGVTLTAIPKTDLLAATPTVANRVTFTQTAPNVTMGWAPQVVTNFDPNPTKATVVATHYTSFNRIVVTPLTWSGTTFSLGTASNVTTLKATSLPAKSRQPDGTRVISGGDDDRYAAAIYQVGDLIYAAHPISVNASGVAVNPAFNASSTNAVHLIVLSASTGAIVAETTYWNSQFDYTFASVAANADGDVVIGLNRSGAAQATGALGAYLVHGRLDLTNPDRTLRITFDQELEVMAGQTIGYHQQQSTLEAWGPYSSTLVDPTNPHVFWTTLQYAVTDTTWGTRVAQAAPTLSAVRADTTAADGTYGVGATIPITVLFEGPVNVTGTPKLRLNSGGEATYTGGTGTDTLTFSYTVAAGHTTSGGPLDYLSTTPFDTSGATITDAATGLPATLVLPAPGTTGSLSASHNLVVDTSSASVTGVSSTSPNGTYGFGAVIPVTVTFSRAVVVTGTPSLALNTGGSAGYAGGSGSTTLTFNYTVGANHLVADLDYASAGALTGGTITDQASGASANLTLPSPGADGSLGANKDIAIDARPARATGVTAGVPNGTYGFGAPITVLVSFTQPVLVSGSPQLALNTGGVATYTSGSGTSTLTFTYTVGAGHQSPDLDYISANALTGGTITDQASGATASTTLPFPGAPGSLGDNSDIVIDTNAPVVTGVTSPTADGQYATGAVIQVTVTFNTAVDVTGTPRLALNSGGSADYVSGSGTTTLTFQYTVAAGEAAADLDYTSVAALTLNGGTIVSTANGMAASLALPAPGTTGSLGFNKALVIDGQAPAVVDFRVLYGRQWHSLTGSTRDVLPWKVTGVRVVFDEPVATGRAQSLTGLAAQRVTGVRSNTLTWRFRAVVRGSFNLGFSTLAANQLKDRAGNAVTGFSQSLEVLLGDFNDDRVVNDLDVAAVRDAQAAPYQWSAGYNPFADLSGDGLVNLVDVGIVRGRKGTMLA